jgi:transcription antitermination factor NusG
LNHIEQDSLPEDTGYSMLSHESENQILRHGSGAIRHWFAIRVRSNFERVTVLHLRERGYEEFAPSHQTDRLWSDRRKRVDEFLFPGYVFCRFDVAQRLPVLTVPGVVGLVGFGKVPSPIPDVEIESIRSMVDSGFLVTPWPFMRRGQPVIIERGPLAGVEGILEQVKGKFRLVVSICLLQRSVSTEVDRNWVRPIRSLTSTEITAPAVSPDARSERG